MGWHEWHPYHWFALPGVYAIYCGSALVYIGQSVNVERRLLSHETMAELVWEAMKGLGVLKDIRVKIRYTLSGDQRDRERRLIRRLRPRLNVQTT